MNRGRRVGRPMPPVGVEGRCRHPERVASDVVQELEQAWCQGSFCVAPRLQSVNAQARWVMRCLIRYARAWTRPASRDSMRI